MEDVGDKMRAIRQGARVVQATTGFTLGLYLFIHGLFFYEKFGGATNAQAVLWLTTIIVTYKIVCLCCDIPAGAIADYLGRRKTIIASFLFQTVFFFCLATMWFVSSPRSAFVIAAFGYGVFGIGYALLSGALVAWIVDSVRIHHLPEGHGPILADSYRFYFVAQLFGTVIGLALYSLGFVFYAFSIGCLACIVCSLYCTLVMEETVGMRFHQGPLQWGETVKIGAAKICDGLRVMRVNPPVFFLALTNACFMFLVFVVTYLWPVALKSQFGYSKLSGWWYAISLSTVIVGYVGARFLQKRLARFKEQSLTASNGTLLRWLVAACFAAALPVCLFALGVVDSARSSLFLLFWGVVATYGGYGFIRPCYETLVNNYLGDRNAHERATVLSVGSSFASLLTIVFMMPSGQGTDTTAPTGWLIPAVLLMGAIAATIIVVGRRERSARLVSVTEAAPIVKGESAA